LGLLLLLAFTLLAHREKEKTQDGPRAGTGSWQRVGSYSGHTHMQTPLVRIDSRTWRLTWTCTADEEVAGRKTFRVQVADDEGQPVGTPIDCSGDGGETTMMETEPGMYFLLIRATNVRWELRIEHQP
jgi:hypothetical protein